MESKTDIWTREIIEERFPDPITPLFQDIFYSVYNPAAENAIKILKISFKDYTPKYKIINGYVYGNYSQLPKHKFVKLFFNIYNISWKIIEDYKNKIEPSNLKYIKTTEAIDFNRLSLKELLELSKEIKNKFIEEMTYQTLFGFIPIIIMKLFNLKVRFLFKGEDLSAKLIASYENEPIKISEELNNLASLAKKSNLSEYFQKYNGEILLERLKKSKMAEEFLKEFYLIIKKYPYQAPKYDFINHTWEESPSMVIDIIKDIVLTEGKTIKENIQEKRLIQEKIKSEIKEKFEKSMSKRFFKNNFYKWFNLIRDITYLKQQRASIRLRYFRLFKKVYLAFGDKLVKRKILKKRDYIFFVKFEELSNIINIDKDIISKKLIKKRKKVFLKQFDLNPPEKVIDIKKKFPLRKKAKKIKLRGLVASRGLIVGRAKIILKTNDFHKLKKGDILVTKTTNPVWTPLFSIASGIITEVGGVLSHAAIVSREFGIPAVVGVDNVTRFLKDNDFIELNANKGLIKKISKQEYEKKIKESERLKLLNK